NPNKCATQHLSRAAPTGARSTPFHIDGHALRILEDGDYYTYLGKTVGFFLLKNFTSVNEDLPYWTTSPTWHRGRNLMQSRPFSSHPFCFPAWGRLRRACGCGIPSAAFDSDFYLVDTAFKLLTSKGTKTWELTPWVNSLALFTMDRQDANRWSLARFLVERWKTVMPQPLTRCPTPGPMQDWPPDDKK
ncbi:hypothetical protein TNIN_59251, partial [Trichonephila inaurata madagascariensis]